MKHRNTTSFKINHTISKSGVKIQLMAGLKRRLQEETSTNFDDFRTPGRSDVRTPGRSDACLLLFSIFAAAAAGAFLPMVEK